MVSSASTLSAESVMHQLKQCGITHVISLPDTESKFMYDAIRADPSLVLVPVCREGESMAIAAGLIMGGAKPIVQIQSTGFFESGDSIRGICLELGLPLVILIGYRGYLGNGVAPRDSAAKFLEPMLDTWGIPYSLVTSDANCDQISAAYQRSIEEKRTVAVLIAKELES
jgi:sulfopyruvate decarboxylase TPP-binding subunit